jgi:hypothetical protein
MDFYFSFFAVLEMESRSLHMLGKHSYHWGSIPSPGFLFLRSEKSKFVFQLYPAAFIVLWLLLTQSLQQVHSSLAGIGRLRGLFKLALTPNYKYSLVKIFTESSSQTRLSTRCLNFTSPTEDPV